MADFEVVERVWLSAVFSEEVARSLPKDSPELERMLSWHWAFKRNLYTVRKTKSTTDLEDALEVALRRRKNNKGNNRKYR